MNKLIIRKSRGEDYQAIDVLCQSIDTEDYVPNAWPIWMSEGGINFIAQIGDRIVGCAHGEVIAMPDGWAQAVRIHPDMHRKGIGLELMYAVEKEFKRRGVTSLFGNIGIFNEPSLAFFTRQNWTIVCTVKRRLVRPSTGIHGKTHPIHRDRIYELVQKFPVLASIEKIAYFKRVYFSMSDDFIEKALASQAIRTAPGSDAYAFIDPIERRLGSALWVTALAGSPNGKQQILEEFMGEASTLDKKLIVDSPDEDEIQAFMDEHRYARPEKSGGYFVVKKVLAEQPGSK